MVACPQRSTSRFGVKNVILKSALSDFSTNAVSDAPTFFAISCFVIFDKSFPSKTTPAGLPHSEYFVKAFNV